MTLLADIVFPLPLTQSFTYIVPSGSAGSARPGVRAAAPLGRKTQHGTIVAVRERGANDVRPLKEIVSILDVEPVFSALTLDFTRRLSGYFHSSWGELLQAALPPSLDVRAKAKVRLTEAGLEAFRTATLSPDERKAAGVLGSNAFTVLHVRRTTGIKAMASLIARMTKKGLVQLVEDKPRPAAVRRVPQERKGPTQLELDFAGGPAIRPAVETIGASLAGKRFASFYLFGGRNARLGAYGFLVQKAVSLDRQVLVLVPGTAASDILRAKFETSFGERAAFLHGQMGEGAREREWQKIKAGRTRVVVGPRSALFAPLVSAGLIIVEEEHDDAFLQTESPAYDARFGARELAAQWNAVVVSGSDVPTVEAFYEAQSEGALLTLPADRERRRVEIVDDGGERGLLTRAFWEFLRANVKPGRPGIVFLNRRGYASFLFCPRCGHIPKCDRCEVSMSYYKKEDRLACRYCGARRPRPPLCPECGSRVMEPRGAGVEAVEEELRRLFPSARVAGFDSDRVRTKAAREKILKNYRNGKIDILAGTHMLAHQTGLPPAAWVGIMNPEALLALADFRASQKTYQAVHRMIRFAADGPGAGVLIQTSFPGHHSIREAARRDYPAFYEEEIRFRGLMRYPPFAALAEIILRGRDPRSLAHKARELARRARLCGSEIEILGPAAAPPSLAKGERGVQVILKSEDKEKLNACLNDCLPAAGLKRSVARYG